MSFNYRDVSGATYNNNLIVFQLLETFAAQVPVTNPIVFQLLGTFSLPRENVHSIRPSLLQLRGTISKHLAMSQQGSPSKEAMGRFSEFWQCLSHTMVHASSLAASTSPIQTPPADPPATPPVHQSSNNDALELLSTVASQAINSIAATSDPSPTQNPEESPPNQEPPSSPSNSASPITSNEFPNGNTTLVYSGSELTDRGLPFFGHRFVQTNTKQLKSCTSRYYYCLGVYACTFEGCSYLVTPKVPQRNAFGSSPTPFQDDSAVCPRHPSSQVQWIRCTGGPSRKGWSRVYGPPCTVVTYVSEEGKVWAKHKGFHNHPFCPPTRPSPVALQEFSKIVQEHPDATPQQLRFGVRGGKPMGDVHPSFTNKDRIAYHRRKTIGNQGINETFAAFLQFLDDLPEKFLLDYELQKPHRIFTFQTKYMQEVLQELEAGFQSDTIEGIIHDPMYNSSTVDLHFTSAYDKLVGRYVPVLISIVFGRTADSFYRHFVHLFSSLSAETNQSWHTFKEQFPGITCDWSAALNKAYNQAILDHTRSLPGGENLTESDMQAFFRSCSVHFMRSLLKVVQNAKAIPRGEKVKRFISLVDKLRAQETSYEQFHSTVITLVKEFPHTKRWINWYLSKRKAASFFPACQNFTTEEHTKFYSRLASTTNAQESLGGFFQMLFMSGGKKHLAWNQTVLNCWTFVNRFDLDRRGVQSGLQPRYGHTHSPAKRPGSKARPRHRDNYKPPAIERPIDLTTKGKLEDSKEPSVEQGCLWEWDSEGEPKLLSGNEYNPSNGGQFCGPKWNIPSVASNTCAFESFLVALYAPHHAGELESPYLELENEKSLLARSFQLMDENRNDDARIIWFSAVYNTPIEDWLQGKSKDVFGDLDRMMMNTTGGFDQSALAQYQHDYSCQREDRGLQCKHDDKFYKFLPGSPIIPGESIISPLMSQTYVLLRVYEGEESKLKAKLKEAFDEAFGDKVVEPCRQKYYDIREERIKNCPGPEKQRLLAAAFDFPHTFVVWASGCSRLSDVPRQWRFLHRRLTLRAVILGNSSHFITMIPMHHGWMRYDGIHRPCFRFFNIEDQNHATGGKCLMALFYEAPENLAGYKRETNWSALFQASNNHENIPRQFKGRAPRVKSIEAKAMRNFAKLRKETNEIVSNMKKEAAAETTIDMSDSDESQESNQPEPKQTIELSDDESKQPEPKQTRKRTANRVDGSRPKGLAQSYFLYTGPRRRANGRRGKCKGCNEFVQYDEDRVLHSWRKNEKRYWNRDIYHCTVECLKRMDTQYRKQLESTTFKQPELRQVVAEMNMRKRTRSETS